MPHPSSDRRTPGKIAQAHGGALFLDEIGDMPLAAEGAADHRTDVLEIFTLECQSGTVR